MSGAKIYIEGCTTAVAEAFAKLHASGECHLVSLDSRRDTLHGCGGIVRADARTDRLTVAWWPKDPSDTSRKVLSDAIDEMCGKPKRDKDRSVLAPDGAAIKISQGVVDLNRWFIHWPGGVMTEQHSRPSDADVLMEYGARKRDQERDTIKRELADLEKRAAELRGRL